MLREAFRGLVPPAILSRRKMGFPTPIGRWLQTTFAPLLDDFVLSPRALDRGYFEPDALSSLVSEHRRGTHNHGDRLWLLLNLEIWHRVFIDEDAPADVLAPALACGFSG